jgi:hypothetical protein
METPFCKNRTDGFLLHGDAQGQSVYRAEEITECAVCIIQPQAVVAHGFADTDASG